MKSNKNSVVTISNSNWAMLSHPTTTTRKSVSAADSSLTFTFKHDQILYV